MSKGVLAVAVVQYLEVVRVIWNKTWSSYSQLLVPAECEG
jgi:hypothetical protein